MIDIVFYVFAALALGGAMGVVAGRSPVASLLFMVVCLGSVAGIYVLLEHLLGGVSEYWQIFLGLFLLVVVLFGRGGLIGMLAGRRRDG